MIENITNQTIFLGKQAMSAAERAHTAGQVAEAASREASYAATQLAKAYQYAYERSFIPKGLHHVGNAPQKPVI